MTVCNAEQTQTETCVVGTTHFAKLCFSAGSVWVRWLRPAPTNQTSAYQPNQHAMNSWDDADLLIDISHLRRSARHQLKKTAGNTSRPNSTNVGTVQGKRPHSASVGAAPSATQAQKVRRIEQRRAKRHKTATARVPSPLAASWAAVRFSKTGPKILVGTECSGLESVMAAFDKMDLGDRAQLQFICEKDTAARNLILAHRRPNVFS